MLTVNKRIPQGRGLAAVLLRRAATVQLDWDVRQKSRFDATDSQGRRLGVFLPRGTLVRGGDVLVADDGSLVQVLAAPQPVLEVRHCPQHGSPFDLLRAAYHLGNRHVALELQPDHLKLEPDHVLADMLRQQHLIVTETASAFEPEGGAYGGSGHGHGHAEAEQGHHDHRHDHSHGHAPAPAAVPAEGARPLGVPVVAAAPAPHVHGPGCGHDHGHQHGHGHSH
jgi:urease accessory protein